MSPGEIEKLAEEISELDELWSALCSVPSFDEGQHEPFHDALFSAKEAFDDEKYEDAQVHVAIAQANKP